MQPSAKLQKGCKGIPYGRYHAFQHRYPCILRRQPAFHCAQNMKVHSLTVFIAVGKVLLQIMHNTPKRLDMLLKPWAYYCTDITCTAGQMTIRVQAPRMDLLVIHACSRKNPQAVLSSPPFKQ